MNFPRSSARTLTLENGLTLILDPHNDHPVISAQLVAATGSLFEDHLLGSGLSHFLEHMVFKGTKHYSGDSLASVVQAAGGHWNAYTSFDRTVYYIDGPSSGLEVFLQVLTDMVFRPLLPETEFLLEKDVIRREIDMGLDDPHQAAMRLLLETAFREDPRRLPVIGHRSAFDAITHQDLVAYHHKRYTSNRCFLVISGDFEEEKTIDWIKNLTFDLKPGMPHEPYITADAPQCSRREGERTFAIPNSKVMLAWKIPQLGHQDMPAYEMLAMMLGSGQSSYLYTELREKQELVEEIGAYTWISHLSEGLLGVSAECDPQKKETVIAAVLDQVARFQQEDLAPALARAKRQCMVSQFRGLTTASGRASDLASNWHEARNLHFTSDFLQRVEQVTEDDIRRCIATLTDRNLTIAQLNPHDIPVKTALASTNKLKRASHTLRLRNGLEIALFPDSRLPLISIQTAFRGGLSSENVQNNGITSLLTATITEGTKNRSAWDIASQLDKMGATLSASAGNNTITISAHCLAEDLCSLLEIWADVLLNPMFPEPSLHRNKISQISSLRESLEDPLTSCLLSLRQLLFGSNSYGLPPHGTVDTVKAIEREEVIAYHEKFFCTENGKVAIAGDFDPAVVIDLLEKHLAPLPSGFRFEPEIPAFTAGLTETLHRDKKQAVLAIGYPGLGVTHEQRFAAMMLLEYASDMAGPIFTRIREELGLAYQVGAYEFLGYHAGMITFYLSTESEQLELAHRELQSQIRIIAENGIPDAVFENVRATVLSSLVLQQQSPGAIARHAAIDLLFGLSATNQRIVYDRIRGLSAEDVRVMAKAFLRDDLAATVMVKPLPAFSES
jgi:zinc protease